MGDHDRTGLLGAELPEFEVLAGETISATTESGRSLPTSGFGAKEYFASGTCDATGSLGNERSIRRRTAPSPGKGELDKSLLRRAEEIIDSLGERDTEEMEVDIESLRGVVLQLWEGAVDSSLFHEQILARLEGAILSTENPNADQVSVFREAIKDLGNTVLSQAHIDVLRRQFMRAGFSPLALLSEVEDDSGNDDDC